MAHKTGSINFGPISLPVGQTTPPALTGVSSNFSATILIDRMGTGSRPWLNTLTSASTLQIQIQSSPDGTVWQDEAGAVLVGGLIPAKGGGNRTQDNLSVFGLDPGATQVRVICTVAGPSPIEVSGSIAAA
jgi:hypothetical protein